MNKGNIIDRVWQYSRHYGNMLGYCERINAEYSSFASLILLFNIFEAILKNRLNNFDDTLFKLVNDAYNKNIISKNECAFLNDSKIGIRKIRNLLSHANISKYNFKFIDDKDEILYPFSENENCNIFYNHVSPIIFNIIVGLIQFDFNEDDQIIKKNDVLDLRYEIIELTPIEILKYKGFSDEDIAKLPEMDESIQYRLAENASDINITSSILKNLFYDDN